MGSDTVGDKPMSALWISEVSTFQGVCLYVGLWKMAFWTEQSVHIIVDGHISGLATFHGCLQGGAPLYIFLTVLY